MITKLLQTSLLALALVGQGCGPGNGGHQGSPAPAYPAKPITLICPWAVGGGTDRMARFVADQLQARLGQPVTVLNQTGGSGAVGHSAGARARPDGHTLVMGTFELSTMHWMGISDLTHENFQPLIQLNADAAAIIVRADAPWPSLEAFLDHLKTNPGKLTMSGTAVGGAWDLARAGFLLAAGLPVNAIRWVPSQGSAPSLVELLGGHVDAVCCSVPEAATQLEAGQLRALAVMSPERLAEFPDVPTATESGVVWSAVGWRGLLVPQDTPSAVVDVLAESCQAMAESDAYKDFMKKNGFAIAVRPPAEFIAFLKEQDAQWRQVIAAAGYARE